MRPLQLDFEARRGPSRVLQILLLVIAGAFAADVARNVLATREEVRAFRERLTLAAARPGSGRPLVKVVAQPVSDDEVARARETIRRLSTPWETLFRSLEAARIGSVTILSVEPDPLARTVSIEAEARNYLAALSFLANLREQRTLRHVVLTRHETGTSPTAQPLRFSVSASWGARP